MLHLPFGDTDNLEMVDKMVTILWLYRKYIVVLTSGNPIKSKTLAERTGFTRGRVYPRDLIYINIYHIAFQGRSIDITPPPMGRFIVVNKGSIQFLSIYCEALNGVQNGVLLERHVDCFR